MIINIDPSYRVSVGVWGKERSRVGGGGPLLHLVGDGINEL